MRTDGAKVKRWARWLGTFVGFPLAGVAARLVVGDIDDTMAAVTGGLVGGAVLGIVQVGIGGIEPGVRARWVAATAVGLAVGLGLGARAVGFDTDASSLVVMGGVSGAAVGIAQAFAVPMRALDRALWAVSTPILWAIGWLITSQVIVDADRHHAVFGSSGAVVVSAATGLLYAARREPHVGALGTVATIDSVVAR
jgi:hypothetical protein